MSDWMPGARVSPQSGGVTLDRSLPPRALWHITWDQLVNGIQPARANVSTFLKNMGYCPHLMWDPFTGDIEQYYPASVGGRALKYNNQDGQVHIQIEIFFTPGCIVNGKTYNTVAETPCVNLDKILAWLDGFGIPRVWPMGAPKWGPDNSRDIPTWNNNAGHYGHCNSPGDDHTDPGPMPDITRGAIAAQGAIILGGIVSDLSLAEQQEVLAAARKTNRYIDAPIGAIPGKVWTQTATDPNDLKHAPRVVDWLVYGNLKAGRSADGVARIPTAVAPAIDANALATAIATHLTANYAHDILVALGQALPKA